MPGTAPERPCKGNVRPTLTISYAGHYSMRQPEKPLHRLSTGYMAQVHKYYYNYLSTQVTSNNGRIISSTYKRFGETFTYLFPSYRLFLLKLCPVTPLSTRYELLCPDLSLIYSRPDASPRAVVDPFLPKQGSDSKLKKIRPSDSATSPWCLVLCHLLRGEMVQDSWWQTESCCSHSYSMRKTRGQAMQCQTE